MAQSSIGRSPTFVVGADRQRGTLDSLVKREQHFSEAYQNNKPLCFNAKAFQKTHPTKAAKGAKDADATLCSPMLVAVADGVSQIEEFGIDASELPNELLNAVEELAVAQLLPGQETEEYCGPISMMRDAYESTESLGSTTILTAIMDNSTRIHGKLHPMIAVCSIGDCELIILRRGADGRLQLVFHTEMQRIDGNAQSPLQLARVDDSIDPDFDPSIAIEVIERGSAVHCVSAFEGDIVVLGSDGVFDNLFIDEILHICEMMLPDPQTGARFKPVERGLLGSIARRIVQECHSKTQPGPRGYPPSPIGPGGKMDDTSVVVAQVVEWTEEHGEAWANLRSRRSWGNLLSCGGTLPSCNDDEIVTSEYELTHGTAPQQKRNYPAKPNAQSFSTYWGSFSEATTTSNYGRQAPMMQRPVAKKSERIVEVEDDDNNCSLM